MSRSLVLMLFVALLAVWCSAVPAGNPPDTYRSCPELITTKGYPFEKHFVKTRDEYILSMFRIPHGVRGPKTPGRPMLLQHGLLMSACDWMMNSADESLAFMLADAGYDVWLGNARGNRYSMNHTTFKINTDQFWDFTYDEMARYDLPAFLDYMELTTGQTRFPYVAHSQGTVMMFARLTEDPALAQRISSFVAMAPAVFIRYATSQVVQVLASLQTDKIVHLLDKRSFFSSTETLRKLVPEVCDVSPTLCDDGVQLICGWDNKDNINQTRWSVYTSHFPAGTSTKDMVHWGQAKRDQSFQRYDYGGTGNKRHYGTSHAPVYDLTQLPKVPMLIMSGTHDDLVDPKDVTHLLSLIPYPVTTRVFEDWGHVDFVWGLAAARTSYPETIEFIGKYQ